MTTNQNNAAQATQEAERNTAVQEYFGYRAWLKPTPSNFRLFEAGFDSAYALLSKLRAPDLTGARIAEQHIDRIRELEAEVATLRAPIADEREVAGVTLDGCLETLFRVGEHLGINYAESRKQPGAPSGVYIKAIEDRVSQAVDAARDEAANLMEQTSRSSGAALIRTLASAPAQPQACPTDVCQAAKADGVLCANDECDRSNGVRPASAPVADRQRLRELVDVVWNEATESTAVPDTPWADRLIDKVFPSLASAPVAGEAVARAEYDRGFSNGWDYGNKHGRELGFSGGVCVALQVITTHDAATIWRDIVQACDTRKMLDYAANVEPDEWELAGFKQYARSELNERKPRKRCVPAAPQASEAVRDALMAFDEAMSLCNDFPELQHHRDALLFAVQKARAALSAQPGAQNPHLKQHNDGGAVYG